MTLKLHFQESFEDYQPKKYEDPSVYSRPGWADQFDLMAL